MAIVDETGAIMVQCDRQPLATRCRTRMLLVGVETEYRLVASTTEPLASFSGVQPGRTAQIIVQAVNGGAQGVASEPVQVTVPLPVPVSAAEPKQGAFMAPKFEDVVVSNGNGNGRVVHARA